MPTETTTRVESTTVTLTPKLVDDLERGLVALERIADTLEALVRAWPYRPKVAPHEDERVGW